MKSIPPKNPGTDVFEAASGEVVVDRGGPATLSAGVDVGVHSLEGIGLEEPAMHGKSADAEWIVEALPGTRTMAVDGNAEAVDAKQRHEAS
jgi:hypothetical protein